MTTWNTIIVDDERIIREGLSQYVPWKQLGYHLMGCAKNTREASSYFEGNKVHLLVTDIEMPGINGLDFLESLSQEKRPAAAIIISGYDCTQYVKEISALEIRCIYMQKPIVLKEFIEALKTLNQHLSHFLV